MATVAIVLTKLKKVEHYDKIKSFLYNVLNNKIIDEYRSIKLVTVENIDEHHGTTDKETEVHHLVLELPNDLQTVFLLNKYNAFKYSEIAEIFDISIKTVESRMSKALKILKAKISLNYFIKVYIMTLILYMY